MKALFQYSRKKLIISTVLFLMTALFLIPIMTNSIKSVVQTGTTPDTSIGYNFKELAEMRDIYGREGARTYLYTRMTYDFIWPLMYLFFLVNVFSFFLYGLPLYDIKFLKGLPFLVFLLDLVENTFCSLYFFYGNRVIGLIATYSSRIKWYTLFFLLILFVLLAVYKIFRHMKRS